jgi:hypothetical protein
MNPTHSELLSITQDRKLFEKISAAKRLIVRIFSDVGNQLAGANLREVHATEKGIKISKGNELQQCPYQVLDIIRDFDMDKGLNIRILHWWGRGMFLFLFFGKNHPSLKNFYAKKKNLEEFSVCHSDRWNYSEIIDHRKTRHVNSLNLDNHLQFFAHLQLVKPISLGETEALAESILAEITALLSLIGSAQEK